MRQQARIPVGLRVMALICRICPCCIVARRWPESGYAIKFRKVQHRCPFCRSYQKIKQIKVAIESEQAKQVAIRRSGLRPRVGSWAGNRDEEHLMEERRSSTDRRSGEDRRKGLGGYTGPERRSGRDRRSGIDRREAARAQAPADPPDQGDEGADQRAPKLDGPGQE